MTEERVEKIRFGIFSATLRKREFSSRTFKAVVGMRTNCRRFSAFFTSRDDSVNIYFRPIKRILDFKVREKKRQFYFIP